MILHQATDIFFYKSLSMNYEVIHTLHTFKITWATYKYFSYLQVQTTCRSQVHLQTSNTFVLSFMVNIPLKYDHKSRASEWLKFNGLLGDNGVHVVHTSHVIIAYTLESLSSIA